MIPEYLSVTDFIALAEKIEESNCMGYNTGSQMVIFGYASLMTN